MDASLHLGSLIAIFHYWRDLVDFSNNNKILYLLFIGSLPLIIVGYFYMNIIFMKIYVTLKSSHGYISF